MSSFLSTTNISLYTIPCAWLTCTAPHIFSVKLYARVTNTPSKDSSTAKPTDSKETEDYRFDHAQPRTFMSVVERNPHPALTPSVKGRLARLEAASWNGYENLGLFASAVVAANVGLLARSLSEPAAGDMERYIWWINVNSLGYLVSRFMFNLFYEHGFSGLVRAGWFYLGVVSCFGLVIRAAGALRYLK